MHIRLLITLGLLAIALSLEATVPRAVTQAGTLPAAIIGKAGPLMGEDIAYFPGDPKAKGYLAIPEGKGPFPAVILIHEWNGLVQRVKETADSFAAEGYVALAADLYSGRLGSNPEENMALVQETLARPDQLIANLNAAVALLKGRSDASGKVATIGWCYGGGVALSFALGGEHHDGTAIFYGRLLDDPERMQHIHHEVYGTFVKNDPSIPLDSVNKFVETMRTIGIRNDVHIYDEVNHGFWLHVDSDAGKNTGPALHAWDRLKAYLKRTLGTDS
jgi:carboxymethylenebutenolidase